MDPLYTPPTVSFNKIKNKTIKCLPQYSTPPDFTTFNPQSNSLLLTLPPEIRSEIFSYALAPFEDTSKAYQKHTYWTRPGYSAPLKTHTELLRTCKRVYTETWFLPFALAEHSFYLTARDRRPPGNLSREEIASCLELIRKVHGDDFDFDNGNGTGDVRVFAQLYILEPGDAFQRVLDTGSGLLRPRRVRLTLRYTDFWHWEDSKLLYVDGTWVAKTRFPDCVRAFVVDFESLERRKREVDIIVEQAVERWVFKRKDERVLKARSEDITVSRWTGSSMFGGYRWLRDEVRPGELDYYVKTVTWRLAAGGIPPEMEDECLTIYTPDDLWQLEPPYLGRPAVHEEEMAAMVPQDEFAKSSNIMEWDAHTVGLNVEDGRVWRPCGRTVWRLQLEFKKRRERQALKPQDDSTTLWLTG